MHPWLAGYFALTLLVPPALGAPRDQQLVRERAISRGLPEEAVSRLLALIDRAETAGVPAQSVADKVLEGLAKGIAPARIAAAAEDLSRRLSLAQRAFAEIGAALAPADRRVSLERLASAIQSGSEDVLDLARASKGANGAALMAAARQLGELRARGVEAPDAIGALAPLAAANRAEEIARVASLFDEYLAEGGRDRSGFLREIKVRGEQRRPIDDVVDPFGTRPDPINHTDSGRREDPAPGKEKPGTAHPSDQSLLEKSDRAGSAPGLDRASSARKDFDCSKAKGKGRPGCL